MEPAGGPHEDPMPPPPASVDLDAPWVPRAFLAARAAELRRSGASWPAIGSALHVATSTAWRLAHDHGI
jgi:hypothetical protein